MKQTQMIVKRNVSDSQKAEVRKDKVKMSKSWQHRREEQHLDDDVEVPAHKTWRVEDVVADAADAAPEQMNTLLHARESMNRFVQSKTQVFEKIEESLRPLCMVEDPSDDEVVEFCILSNELNACEITAILNPSKFASCATRSGLRQGFAVDLTTARANGTTWDLSLEDDKADLRRVQNREQPELLLGCPSSDEFSSLLSTRAAREISKLKTEKIEPQIRACVQSYKMQMEMQKHFVHEDPKDSGSWEMLEIQSLINDPRVYSIDGPMCRWSLRTRRLKDKTEVMRKRTRWITSSKEIAEVLRGDGRRKRDKRYLFIHMTGKSETVSEYPASLVVAMLKATKRQMISDGVIRIEEMHFSGPVPDEGDSPTELEGKWGVDGTWIDPKLLIAGRKEEMEYMMKLGVFEVVDEKECYDNGCKPPMFKWVDKMNGEKCRSRLVCREIKKARDRDEQLGPEDVFSPMSPSEGLKMLVSTMMTGHDDGNHVDGPFEMATWDVSRAHFYGEARRWI